MNIKKAFFDINDLKLQDIQAPTNNKRSFTRTHLDDNELKSIYESAFLFSLLYNFAKENQPKPKEILDNSQFKEASTDTQIDLIKEKVFEFLNRNDIRTNSEEKYNKYHNRDELWNSDDLNDLRSIFYQTKDENQSLRSRILVMELENKELKEKYEQLKNDTRLLPDEKFTLEKENKRVTILIQEMEKELIHNAKDIDLLVKEGKYLKSNLDLEKKQNQVLLNKCEQFEFKLRKYENDLLTMKSELKLKYKTICDNFKLKCENKLKEKQKELKKVKEELTNEKETHLKTQSALKQLRMHFMGELFPDNSASKLTNNQIKVV
jgi:hypothetical protein